MPSDSSPGPVPTLKELRQAFSAVVSGGSAPAGLEEAAQAMVALRASLHGWPQKADGVAAEEGEEQMTEGTNGGKKKKKKKKAKSKNRASVSVTQSMKDTFSDISYYRGNRSFL